MTNWEHKSEKDKLIWKLAHTASALTDAIRVAAEIDDDDEFVVSYLRQKAAVGQELLK